MNEFINPKSFAKAKANRRAVPRNMRFDDFKAGDGTRLRYAVWPQTDMPARGTVIFLPGRTEFIEKFTEDMRLLHGLGFAVAGMDLRGQGGSERPYGDPDKHELDSFDPHVSDVGDLLVRLEGGGLPAPFVLMAHSAGSHVSLRVLHDHADKVAAAVTVAPMVRIASGGIPAFVAALLPRIMVGLGLGSRYVPGHSIVREGLWGWRKQLTHDDERFRDEDYFTERAKIQLAVGGATYRWVAAANRSCDLLSSPGYPEAIKAPVLMIQAGHDTIVDNAAMTALSARIPNAELVVIDGAKHEILKETDTYRADAWSYIAPFLDRVAPNS